MMSASAALAMMVVVLGAPDPRADTAPKPPPGLAGQLIQGCLAPPSEASASELAGAVGATAYSEARVRLAMRPTDPTIVPDASTPGQAQRTRTAVTVFRGWDLPGPGAGSLEYKEQMTQTDWVELSTRQSTTAVRATRGRACEITAPVASGRAIFELYERLHAENYGMLISSDRRVVTVFTFDPDRYDIELSLQLDAPLAGLPAGSDPSGMSRIQLSDGGPRFIGDVSPGVSVVPLTRAAMLAALDRPATMRFGNTAIEPVVQRLAAQASIVNGAR